MSVYKIKGKRKYRFDFVLKGQRYGSAIYKTKSEAENAEKAKRLEVLKQNGNMVNQQEGTDLKSNNELLFEELLCLKLDDLIGRKKKKQYNEYCYKGKRWLKLWGKSPCSRITSIQVSKFFNKRNVEVSAHTANSEIRHLKAVFNYGIFHKLITVNPVKGIHEFSVAYKKKKIVTTEKIDKVIAVAGPNEKDYLSVFKDTLARMTEVNLLEWNDIDFEKREITLYTNKKLYAHTRPRTIPLTSRLYKILKRRYEERYPTKPWVFWHRYWSQKEKRFVELPYKDRKKLMKLLCKKAKVKYFRFHQIRHSGATRMERAGVPITDIQYILGHESRKTTEIYLHCNEQDVKAAFGKYEQHTEPKKEMKNSHIKSHIEKM